MAPQTAAHVREAVALHHFADPEDWSAALAELAEMTEDEIDALVSDGTLRQ